MVNDEKVTIGILALQGAFQEHLACLTRLNQVPLFEDTNVKINPILVRTGADLAECDALILPGGESTTIALLARVSGLLETLREFVRNENKAVWGTCAGAILMAEHGVKKGEKQGGQELFGGVNIVVERNGWGGQVESFETSLYVEGIREPNRAFRGVFIRSPLIIDILPPTQSYAISQPARASSVLHSQASVSGLSYPSTQTLQIPEIQVLARLTSDLLPISSNPNVYNDDDPTDPIDDRTIVALRQGRKLITTFHPELTPDTRFHEYFIKECIFGKQQ